MSETREILKKLEATRTLGFPVRVSYEGLLALAVIPPLGPKLLAVALDVLDLKRSEKTRYFPLLDLLQIERSIAESLFPDAPSTVPEHMRDMPDWLRNSPIEGPEK